MSSRYWIADLHLGHAKVAELRGFDRVDEHDSLILDQLDALPKSAHVWVLGDVTSGHPAAEKVALDRLSTVRPSLHLIAGNHDSVSSIHRDGWKRQAEWLEAFGTVQQFGRIRIENTNVLMSHYPYARSGDGPDRGPGRYDAYRLADLGWPLIHGHTHQSKPHMAPGDGSIDLDQFCVSWDVKRGLADEGDIATWIKYRREVAS